MAIFEAADGGGEVLEAVGVATGSAVHGVDGESVLAGPVEGPGGDIPGFDWDSRGIGYFLIRGRRLG